MLRARVRDALEAAGVTMAVHALAPRVGGDLRGSVNVRRLERRSGDAAGLLRGFGQG